MIVGIVGSAFFLLLGFSALIYHGKLHREYTQLVSQPSVSGSHNIKRLAKQNRLSGNLHRLSVIFQTSLLIGFLLLCGILNAISNRPLMVDNEMLYTIGLVFFYGGIVMFVITSLLVMLTTHRGMQKISFTHYLSNKEDPSGQEWEKLNKERTLEIQLMIVSVVIFFLGCCAIYLSKLQK